MPWRKPYHFFDGQSANELMAPAARQIPVTKADSDLPDGPPKGLLVGTAGTANVMDLSGAIRANVPLQEGYNPITVRQVRTGGTASDVWALY